MKMNEISSPRFTVKMCKQDLFNSFNKSENSNHFDLLQKSHRESIHTQKYHKTDTENPRIFRLQTLAMQSSILVVLVLYN